MEKVPYHQLGKVLKDLRTRSHETLAEASGAVEIDVKELVSFELGKSRPTEDVLLLLLSHFGAKDDEAVKLWELAGYNLNKIPASHMTSDAEPAGTAVLLGGDPRIIFTDVVDVVVNNFGVVMNFMQNGAQGKAPTSVARVGMSREHAKSVLQILQMTLNQTEPKVASPDSQAPDTKAAN